MDLAAFGNLLAGAAAAVAAWEAAKTAKNLLEIERRRQLKAEEATILEEKRRVWLANMLAELHVASRRNMEFREWPAIQVEPEEADLVRWARRRAPVGV